MNKVRRFLGHINLADDTWGGNSKRPSIPSQLEEIVLLAVERICGRNGIGMHGTKAEIEEFEAALDAALSSVGWKLKMAREDTDRAEFAEAAYLQGRIYAAVSEGFICGPGTSWYPDDDAALEALLLYQLDKLIGLYQSQDFDRALHLFADICEIQKEIAENELRAEIGANTDWQKSREARARAKLRHKSTSEQKAAALAEWEGTRNEYESRADFVRIIGDLRGIKYRTLYEWIASHEKSKD